MIYLEPLTHTMSASKASSKALLLFESPMLPRCHAPGVLPQSLFSAFVIALHCFGR